MILLILNLCGFKSCNPNTWQFLSHSSLWAVANNVDIEDIENNLPFRTTPYINVRTGLLFGLPLVSQHKKQKSPDGQTQCVYRIQDEERIHSNS